MVTQVSRAEDNGEVHTWRELLVLGYKLVDVVPLRGALGGSLDGLLEVRVIGVTCQPLDEVTSIELEDHIHPALEVKPQADLLLASLLEGVSEEHLLVGHGVEISLPSCFTHLLRLTIVVIRNEGEGQVKRTDQSQAHCDEGHKSFVLHRVVLLN